MRKLYRTALVLVLLLFAIGFVSAEKVSGISVRGGLSYGMTLANGFEKDCMHGVEGDEPEHTFENDYMHLGPGLRVDYVDGSLLAGGRFSCLFSCSQYWTGKQTDEYQFMALKAGGHVAWQSRIWFFGLVMDYMFYNSHPMLSTRSTDMNIRHALFIGGEMGIKCNMTDHLYTFMECAMEYSPFSLRSVNGGNYEFEIRPSLHQECQFGISYIF